MKSGLKVLCVVFGVGAGCGDGSDSGDDGATATGVGDDGDGGDDGEETGGDGDGGESESADGGESTSADGGEESTGAGDGGGPPGPGAACDSNYVCGDPYVCELKGGPPTEGVCADFGARICADDSDCLQGCSDNCECHKGMQRESGQCFVRLFASPTCYSRADCPAGWDCIASTALPSSGQCFRPIQ